MTKKKYVFTGETMVFHHGFPEEKTAVLQRIQAVVDIPLHGVKAGDLGGFIESEENLTQKGKAWVANDALVFDDSIVAGDAIVAGTSIVKQSCITGKVSVNGQVMVESSVLKGKFSINGKVEIRQVKWNIRRGEVLGTEYSDYLFNSEITKRNIFIDDTGICFLPPIYRYEGLLQFFTASHVRA